MTIINDQGFHIRHWITWETKCTNIYYNVLANTLIFQILINFPITVIKSKNQS